MAHLHSQVPLSEMGGRPRVDVLCNMSGIFRDSFQVGRVGIAGCSMQADQSKCRGAGATQRVVMHGLLSPGPCDCVIDFSASKSSFGCLAAQ